MSEQTTLIHGGFYPLFFKQHPEGLSLLDPLQHKGGGKRAERARRMLRTRHVEGGTGAFVALGQEDSTDPKWGDVYEGQEGFAFYGHDPTEGEVRKHPFAAGLDTGCVFGGRLTAHVWSAASGGRKIIIGDIHGCVEELDELLKLLDPGSSDKYFFLGDVVDKGPDSLGALDRVYETLYGYPGSVCILGNHEEKALRYHRKGKVDQFKEAWLQDVKPYMLAMMGVMPYWHQIPQDLRCGELVQVQAKEKYCPAYGEVD